MSPEEALSLDNQTQETSRVHDVGNEPTKQKQLSLGRLIYLLALRRQDELVQKSKDGMLEIQEKNRNMAKVNSAMQAINALDHGDLDLKTQPDILEALKQAKEAGAQIDLSKTTYTAEQRNRLLDNLRLTTDSLGMQTQTEMQQANLISQVYENFTLAKPIISEEHRIIKDIERRFTQ